MVAVLDMLEHPALDQPAREQQLAGDAAEGDRLLAHQLVDLAFLEPQELGDFLGGQELRHNRLKQAPSGGRFKRCLLQTAHLEVLAGEAEQ